MANSNKKILVTGGTGFIGTHTTVALQEKGYRVLIADNLSNSTIDSIQRIESITGIKPDFIKADLSKMEECNTQWV
jgi:UDP-glucose 4-epimerase